VTRVESNLPFHLPTKWTVQRTIDPKTFGPTILHTQQLTHPRSLLRIVIAVMTLLPSISFSVLHLIALSDSDLETWLKRQTGGFFRKDAFEGLIHVSPLFAVTLAVTSLLAMHYILSHRSRFLLPLLAGPALAAVVYLVDHGLTDPSWYALLALMSIGMLAGTPVTFVWALWKTGPNSSLTPDEARGSARGKNLTPRS
jgi:hypothetical protein